MLRRGAVGRFEEIDGFGQHLPDIEIVGGRHLLRLMPADLPGVAKKVIGDTNTVTQSEEWRPDGDGYTCDFAVEIANVPGGMTGWMKIVPVGKAQSDWILEYSIKVSIPLIGGKLEGVMKDETRANLEKEFAFNSAWVAGA